MVYVSIVGITYFVNYEEQKEKHTDFNVTMLYALSSTTMGVVDTFVWFLTIYVHRKFDLESNNNYIYSKKKRNKNIEYRDITVNSNGHGIINNNNRNLKRRVSSRSRHRFPTPMAPYDISVDS